MSHTFSPLSKWVHISLYVVLTIGAGCFQLTVAQGPLPDVPTTGRSDNPLPDETSPRISAAAAARRQAIKRAIGEGNTARDSSEFEKAIASYRKVAEDLDPRDPRAFLGLGNIYSDLACNDNAIRAYQDALRLKKDYRDAILALGYAYANKERLEEAEAQFRMLASAKRKDVAADIGLAYVAQKRKQYPEAIAKLKLISEDPSIADKDRALAALTLGQLHFEQKNYAEASAEFKKVLGMNQFLANAHIKLGQAELFSASSRYSLLVNQEITIADREKMIKAASFAAENIRTAIIVDGYKHPVGYLLLSNALIYQFSYHEAESTLNLYLEKVKALEKQVTFLSGKCDYGFNQLYSFGYTTLATSYNQQSLRETDSQKKAAYQQQVIENANRLIELKESDPVPYQLLGQVYTSQGKWREAIEQLAKAITYETNADTKASTYDLIGECYTSWGQLDDAIAAFNEALKIRPTFTSSRWGLARVHEKRGNFDEAIRLKKEAIGYEPRASSYWLLASTYLARARQNNSDADFDETIRLLKKSLELSRGFAPAYFLLGQTYKFYKGGLYADDAIANYELAIKYDPNDAASYLHLGDLYYSVKKNNDAAISVLRQAVKLNPNYARAHWELGVVYRDTGDYAEALKSFQEAIRSDDKDQDAYFGLLTVYKRQKNYSEAIKIINRVFEIAPKEFWPYKELAKIYEDLGKNEDAIRYYQQSISLLKDIFGKELYACRIERLRRNYATAIRCFENLKPPSSEDPGQLAYDLGLTYVASGDRKAAQAQYDRLKQIESQLAVELLSKINQMN